MLSSVPFHSRVRDYGVTSAANLDHTRHNNVSIVSFVIFNISFAMLHLFIIRQLVGNKLGIVK